MPTPATPKDVGNSNDAISIRGNGEAYIEKTPTTQRFQVPVNSKGASSVRHIVLQMQRLWQQQETGWQNQRGRELVFFKDESNHLLGSKFRLHKSAYQSLAEPFLILFHDRSSRPPHQIHHILCVPVVVLRKYSRKYCHMCFFYCKPLFTCPQRCGYQI